jgi:hypothetical protein
MDINNIFVWYPTREVHHALLAVGIPRNIENNCIILLQDATH